MPWYFYPAGLPFSTSSIDMTPLPFPCHPSLYFDSLVGAPFPHRSGTLWCFLLAPIHLPKPLLGYPTSPLVGTWKKTLAPRPPPVLGILEFSTNHLDDFVASCPPLDLTRRTIELKVRLGRLRESWDVALSEVTQQFGLHPSLDALRTIAAYELFSRYSLDLGTNPPLWEFTSPVLSGDPLAEIAPLRAELHAIRTR